MLSEVVGWGHNPIKQRPCENRRGHQNSVSLCTSTEERLCKDTARSRFQQAEESQEKATLQPPEL